MSESRQRLKQLLDYVQHLLCLPDQPTLSVKSYGKFLYLQETLQGRLGIMS